MAMQKIVPLALKLYGYAVVPMPEVNEAGLGVWQSKGVAGPGMFMGGGRPEFVDLEMVVDGKTIDLTLGNYGLFGAAGGIDQQELLSAFKNAKRQF